MKKEKGTTTQGDRRKKKKIPRKKIKKFLLWKKKKKSMSTMDKNSFTSLGRGGRGEDMCNKREFQVPTSLSISSMGKVMWRYTYLENVNVNNFSLYIN